MGKFKFDVVIGNPPYQEDTNGAGRQARPLYNLFVDEIKKLKPEYIDMIIPSRWFAGGMGLGKFREDMMDDGHIARIVDYTNAKDCFPDNSISGGVCYFIWDKDKGLLAVWYGQAKRNKRSLYSCSLLLMDKLWGLDVEIQLAAS